MPHDARWSPTAPYEISSRALPEDPLHIVKKLIRSPLENMAPMLAGLIHGYVAWRDDQQRHAKGGLGHETL